MPLTQEEFLNQFTRQALDERISLFVGAGASINAGYPSWYNLFKPRNITPINLGQPNFENELMT